MARYIKWFKELSKKDVAIAGGKASNLGEMFNAGFPVPPGFVVLAETYKEFISKKGIDVKIESKLKDLNVEDTEKLQAIAKEIQELIKSQKMPATMQEEILAAYSMLDMADELKGIKVAEELVRVGRDPVFVAVRSSATAEDLPSVGEDEFVFVKIDSEPFFGTIKELYDKVQSAEKVKLEVPTMKKGKLIWSRAFLYRHKGKGKLFKIKTASGKEITISGNHSLIFLDEKNLKPRIGGLYEFELNKKLLVPVSRRVPINIYADKFLDVCKYLPPDKISIEDGYVFIKDSSNYKIQNPLPAKIRLSKDFLYFLGLYLAEGSTYSNNCVIITNNSKLIQKQVITVLQKLGLYKNQKINKGSIRIYCKALVLLLHALCGKPANTKGKGRLCVTKKVPNFVFGLSKEQIRAVLSGYIDGDGSVLKNNIEFSTKSKRLFAGLVKLFELLGAEVRLRRKKGYFVGAIPATETEIKKLDLRCKEKAQKLLKLKSHYTSLRKIHIESEKIREELERLLPKEKQEVHFCKICKSSLNQTSSYNGKKRFICNHCRKTFYEEDTEKKLVERYVYYDNKGHFKKSSIPWNKGLLSGEFTLPRFKQMLNKYGIADKFEEILSDDILWERIKTVEEVNYNSYVYDFVVPGTQNFLAGLGGIITHNTASFAGQQATFLNVKGSADLIKAVQACWASLFTARAIYYRVKNNFPHMKVAIAVVVQKMVNSEKSGVMFSINPATNNKEQIVIEAAFGLGEAVVSGAVNPNTYVVDKKTKKILEKDIPGQDFKIIRDINTGKNTKVELSEEEKKKQVLNEAEILALSQLAEKVEQHYNFPQDMEWAIERNKIFLVQTRPVTTLKKKEKEVEIKAEAILKGLGASPGIASGKVRILSSASDIDKLQKGEVLVTKMTNPDFVPAMQRASAIITNEGGITSHAAIVSREMGVPCVVGTKEATSKLKDGEEVTVDGSAGLIYSGKIEIEKPEEKKQKKEIEVVPQKLVTATEIYVIMDLPEFAERAAATGADGVGLLRLEGIIASGKIHPAKYLREGKLNDYTNLLVEGITKIATPFKDKTVWVRTSDIRTDEYRGLEGGEEEPKESNPMLGWHGIRRSLSQPELLKAEFTALKKVHDAGLKKVGVMIPFVISVDEVRKAKEICREAGLEPGKDIEFGVMVETPASVWIIEDLCKEGINFISLGTNDLTQTTLGVDRNNERIANLYDWNHPAVKQEVKKVIEVCKKYKVHTSICGQAGSDPKFVPFLIECGIDSVSANPDAVSEIRKLIYEEEKKLLLEAAREKTED